MLDLLEKEFNSAILNMLKILMETMSIERKYEDNTLLSGKYYIMHIQKEVNGTLKLKSIIIKWKNSPVRYISDFQKAE
jgi:hypothetical protein